MFELYLTGSGVVSRREGCMMFQIQLAHRQIAVPLTRDYRTDAEREPFDALAQRESVDPQ